MVYSQDSGYRVFRPYVGAGMGLIRTAYSRNPRFGAMGRVAGTNSAMVNRRSVRKGRTNTFAKKVRNLAPYKHNTINDSTNTTTMTHNTIYTTSITAKVGQGLTNTDRIGDFIHPVSLKVKGLIVAPTTAGAYYYRILVGYSGEEYNVSASNAGLTATEIFLPSQGGFVQGAANVNPKAFTCLYDEMVDVNSVITATSDLKSVSFTVPLSGKFSYQASASAFGKTRNLYFVIIGHVVGGVNGTTACGVGSFNSDLVFQDS